MSNLSNQFTNAISNLNQINVNGPTVVTSVNTANLATCTNLPPSNITTTNVILQTLKRRNTKVVVPLDERVTLEKAYGFTITSNSRLTQSCDGTIAYLAGCVIVLHDRNKQNQEFIISHARKTLTTVAFSADGRCLATGESGHEPKVRVWDVKEKIQICEFGGHKFSIECVCFSTNLQSNLIVSIGSIHDMVVNVWNLKTKFKVASNKIACKVKGIAFTRDGSFFVTVGNRHVKYWYLTVSSLMETVPLKGRAAILGEMRNSYFCDVVCGTGECVHSTYTITTNGVLCEFNNEQRCITRNIELRTEHAYCIYADNRENLFIGCSNGSILMYRQKNLEILASLPRPHSLGVDISKGLDMRHIIENLGNHELKYPDCVALCYDNHEGIISAIYNDHSFYVWDIKDPNKVKKLDSHLFHSSCCWSLDTFAGSLNNSQCSQQLNLPLDSFITCSSDNTVRIWSTNTTVTPGAMLKRNIYSKELLKIIYIENDLSALCEIDPTSENADQLPNQQSIQQQHQQQQQTVANSVTNLPVGSINNLNVNSNELANNSKMGARCLKISPFGKHLATGDRNGNIRITDLSTLESIALIEAHDGEVLYLQYSQPESNRLLLASSSRDRLIHIFDASRNTYDLLQTLDDHSAAITAVRFCFNQIEKQLYIISCGADKSIMFRTATSNSDHSGGSLTSSGVGSSSSSTVSSSSSSPNFNSSTTTPNQSAQFQFLRTSYVAEKQTFYDLNLDPARNYIYTISQDRIIRTYSIKDGKKLRQFRGSLNEDGYLLKMDIDRTGSLLATSCTDKCVYIWDINTTECVAYLCGHSEVVTDLKFTADQQHLITVSADGCVFMWKLNNLLNTHTANSEHTSNGLPWPSSTRKLSSNYSSSSSSSNIVQIDTNTNKFSMNTTTPTQLSLDSMFDSDNEQLPAWARNKLNSGGVSSSIDNSIASACLNDSENVKMLMSEMGNDQPRRGRAVWGPVLDASLSFMVDNENQSIISSPNSFFVEENGNESSSNHSWIIEKEESNEELDTEDASYDSVHTTIVHNNSQFDETSAMVPTIPEENIDEQTQSQTAKSDAKTLSNIIQFPSPSVDKDVFLVKKLNQLKEAISSSSSPNTNIMSPNMSSSSVRKSWICSTNEEDLLFSLLNKMKPENSSSFDSDQELTPGATSSLIDSNPEAMPTCNASSLSEATSSSDELISSGGNKSSSFLSTDSPLSRTQSLLGDTTIKLDCDLENSFRRQSISARYLLRAQQQQQQQHHHQNQPVNKSFEHEKSQSPTYSMSSSSTSSSVHSSPNLKKDLHSKPPPSPTSTTTTTTPPNTTSSTVNSEHYLCIKETEEEIDLELIAASTTPIPTPIPVSNSSSSINNNNNTTTSKANSSVNSNQINIGQMAADLLKMRKKAAQLTTQPNSINNTSNNKLLHSHHTESSLNKTKQKQAQHQRHHQDQLGQNPLLKRSPSVNSIVAGNTQTNATLSNSDVAILQALPAQKNGLLSVGGDSSASSSSSSIKLSSKPKLSPKQHSNSQHTNSTNLTSSASSAANNTSEDNNLKKAVSMITLFSNQTSTKPSSAITTATTASAKSYSNGSQKNIASSSSSTCSSNKPEPINSGTLLPPKTVRQVKQRSAERQLTSTAILTSTVTPKLSSSTGITSNIAANTFNEQKKHLRKLSNSIQNLHQVVASATAPPSTSSIDLTSGGTGVAAAVNAFNKMNGNNLLPPQPPPTKSSPKSSHFGSTATQQSRIDSKHLTSSNSISLDQTVDTFLLQSDGKQDQENEKQQISSVNSLISSSSSSSSCSLFDNVSSISSSTGHFDAVKSLEANADDVSSSSSNSTNTNNKSKSSGFNSRFSENTNRQQNANSSSFSITNTSPSSSTACNLKKPITFASIAAAANSGISSPLPITSSSHISSPQPSKFTSYSNTVSPLTSNKIESIIDEFKKNVFLLQLVSNQTPKIAEDLSKFHPNSVGLQSSASHQTIQLMQTFNTTVQSLVYKFNSSLNAIKLSSVVQQQQSTPISTTLSSNELTSSNSETIKLDTDLEIS